MTKASVIDRLDTEIPFHILRLKQAYASLLVLPDSYQAIAKLLVQVEMEGQFEMCHESINDITDALMMLNVLSESAEDLTETVEEWIPNGPPSMEVVVADSAPTKTKKRVLDA